MSDPAPRQSRRVLEAKQIFKQTIALRSGRNTTITLTGPKYHLLAELRDHFGKERLAERPYVIRGDKGSNYEGKTDSQGRLEHREVRPENYGLAVEDPAGVTFHVGLPWVTDPSAPHIQAVYGYGAFKIFAEISSAKTGRPLAGEAYILKLPQGPLRGITDSRGRLGSHAIPLSIVELITAGVRAQVQAIPLESDTPHQLALNV